MQIAVIKFCKGYDKTQEDHNYSDGSPIIGPYKDRGPVGWHSYAATTQGFALLFQETDDDYDKIMNNSYDVAILLIDNWMSPIEHVAELIKSRNIPIFLGMHENMFNLQILYQLSNGIYIEHMKRLTDNIKPIGWIVNTPQHMKLFWDIFEEQLDYKVKCLHIPFCWDMSLSHTYLVNPNDKSGIFIGGMRFELTPGKNLYPRNTLYDVILAAKAANTLEIPVYWYLSDSHSIIPNVKKLFKHQDLLHIYTEKLLYPDWLRTIAKCKVYINIDFTSTQGQAPGDCAFLNIPCIGGNSETQRLVFPDTFETLDLTMLYKYMMNLLTNDKDYNSAVDKIEETKHVIDSKTVINQIQKFVGT